MANHYENNPPHHSTMHSAREEAMIWLTSIRWHDSISHLHRASTLAPAISNRQLFISSRHCLSSAGQCVLPTTVAPRPPLTTNSAFTLPSAPPHSCPIQSQVSQCTPPSGLNSFEWLTTDRGIPSFPATASALYRELAGTATQEKHKLAVGYMRATEHYVTARIKDDDMTKIFVQDVSAEKDAITAFRLPPHFGCPNWDHITSGVA
ncbi:hypothetical protein EI94DRAFT_1813925 [Lactarius quietus]|nr:hypothetical protein EI94DRAFT_1813925 [Lactarius quietus]